MHTAPGMANQRQQGTGAESQMLQAGRDIVVTGLSAADVVEITRREVARVAEELSLDAKTVAEERVKALGDKILERFSRTPDQLGAFKDPDFQFSLSDAGRAAASNDDEHTEDLLVDLLANRAEAGNTSRVRLATSQAIRAADKLSIETLNGITALWALTFLSPKNLDDVASQLRSEIAVAESLAALGLPDDDWLQEAEALNLTRGVGGQLVSRKTYGEIRLERAARHLLPGIPKQQYDEAVQAEDSDMPDLTGKVLPHQLKPDHVVLRGSDRESFLALFDPEVTPPPALDQLIAMNGFGERDPQAVEQWNRLLHQRPAVATVEAWWDAVPYAELTLTGRVIGFVNGKRHVRFVGAQTVAELLSSGRA